MTTQPHITPTSSADVSVNAAISFLGTSHVSPESIAQIRTKIDTFKPDIVCVELDRGRLSGLLKKQKASYSPRLIFDMGLAGYFFAIIGGFVQQKFGNLVGTTPGADMLTAVSAAREQKISVALIDQPIQQTMRRISAEFGLRDIFHMFIDFFKGLLFPKKMKKEMGLSSFSLSAAPTEEFVSAALTYLSSRYPGIYKAILVERNEYMLIRIAHLRDLNPAARILVVVGAAHVPGMRDSVRKHYKSLKE